MARDEMRAIRRHPMVDGSSPLLEAGQYCQDRLTGSSGSLYHFRTPDGLAFAMRNVDNKGRPNLESTGGRLTLLHPPSLASRGQGAVENVWTIRNGWWERISVY